MLKTLFLLHRWLGISLGLLMLLWCLSGLVMMYKPYPELSEGQKLATYEPLDLAACCSPSLPAFVQNRDYESFRISMRGTRPVLELTTVYGELVTVELHKGRLFKEVPDGQALELSRHFAAARGYPAPEFLGSIARDQWTVYGAYDPHRPLYHFAANDAAGTEWYLSSRTGEVLQLTTFDQRLWGWMGAVIHWLYPTMLRQHVALWSQSVIWLTVLGLFLTLTGLYFGIRQYKTRSNGRKSPYRGLSLWHHYFGLFFGLLTLTWLVSGFFSMQPWGLLEGEGAGEETVALQGGAIGGGDVLAALAALDGFRPPPGTVLLEGRKLENRLYLLARDREENIHRFDAASLAPAPLGEKTLQRLARGLANGKEPLQAGLMQQEDAYYYNHHVKVRLPVFKVVADDPQQTHYYLDPASGELLNKVDGEDKWYRWLHYGLHRGDFTGLLRSRPIWDLFMWPLMLGVTLICASGFLMGLRRLKRVGPR